MSLLVLWSENGRMMSEGGIRRRASCLRRSRPRPHSALFRSQSRAIDMDEELELLTKDQLIAEVKKLRGAIREHRDSTKHELCWYHPQLWSLLPEKTDPQIE